MLAAATGVTEGKLDTQSRTYVPRSTSAFSAGARPWAIARSSISGFSESTTARTSFLGFAGTSAEDPQPLVLLAALASGADEKHEEREQHREAERWQRD